jgi:magnesium-transporting ATPase (P-type)
MRKFSKDTSEQVVETLSSDTRLGLSLNQVGSLRKAHGLNKLEEEEKVFFFSVILFNLFDCTRLPNIIFSNLVQYCRNI